MSCTDPVHRKAAFDLLTCDAASYFAWPPADSGLHRKLRLLDVNLSSEPSHSNYPAYGERGQRSHKTGVANTFTLMWKLIGNTADESRAEDYETYLRPFNNKGTIITRYRPDGGNVVPSTANPVKCFDWDANTFNPQGGQANTDWDATNQAPVDGSVEHVSALPTTPTGESATAAAGPQITVAWTQDTEEWVERAGFRAVGYRVLRGVTTGVYDTQIILDPDSGVVSAVAYASPDDDAPDTLQLSATGREVVEIVDDTTAPATEYFYVVETVDYFNYISAQSTEVSDTTP